MKTFIIEWRYYLDSYPEVSWIEAKDESEALEILREKEGHCIVIESVDVIGEAKQDERLA